MRFNYRLVLIATLTLMLFACAQQRYTAPTSGTTATLTIVNRTTMQAFFRTFDDENCTRGPASGVIGILQGGLQIYDNKTTAQTNIRADRPFVFTVDAHTYGALQIHCTVSGVFAPQAGAAYEMEYTYSARARSCMVHLWITASPAGPHSKERVEIRRLGKSCSQPGD
jgi:hypothetical protein